MRGVGAHLRMAMLAIAARHELRAGNPSIWVREEEDDCFIIRMPTLKEGGEKVIADRLREILS